MSRTEQKVLHLDSKFGNFVLATGPVPRPGAGDLLVKVEAAALNPVDWKIQKHGIFIEKYPAVLGSDFAGIIEEVGEGVDGFSKGDRVFYQGIWRDGFAGYQQYALTKADLCAKVPSNVTTGEAASIAAALAAAAIGFYTASPKGIGLTSPFDPSGRNKYAGQPLVVLGGASSVGQLALQLGRLSGFSPIITTASLKHSSFLKELGATHIIDRHISLSQLPTEVGKITSDSIQVVYDAISLQDTNQAGYDLLASGGKMVSVLSPEIKTVPDKENVRVYGGFMYPETKALGVSIFSKMTELLADGSIKPNRVEVLPGGLSGVVEGLRRLENDLVSGVKLVVHPQETV